MAIHRSWTLCATAGGGLLGVVSVFWLAKSVELVVANARCCMWAAEGDGRRGIFFAMTAGGFQLATLVVAVAVVRHRAQRTALAAILLYSAITVLLMTDGRSGEVQLLLNLIALVVAGLTISAELLVARSGLDLVDHDGDVTERSLQHRRKSVAVVVGTTALLGTLAVLAAVGGLLYLRNELFDNELPGCDREPVVLDWTQRDGRWQRSETFDLFEDSQTVQVDLILHRDDGGVIQTGKTVYVIAAGGTVPADNDETTPTTQPFRGTAVGRGIDGVNEQVTLDAGEWQLIVKGGASAAEVRWPC